MKRLALLFTVTVLAIGALSGFLAGRATADQGDGAFTGWKWSSPTLTLVDAYSGPVYRDVIESFEQATGVRIVVKKARRFYCGPDGERSVYRRAARRGAVVLCDMGRAPFLNGYTDSWIVHHRNVQAVTALRHLPTLRGRRNTFCHELGHVFGLDHWDDPRGLPLPYEAESCTSGTADGLGPADELRLRAVYQGGMPEDLSTVAYVLGGLGCTVAPDLSRVEVCG